MSQLHFRYKEKVLITCLITGILLGVVGFNPLMWQFWLLGIWFAIATTWISY